MRFTFEQLSAFAAVSGDVNPLHTSAGEARRGPFGEPIVHGVLVAMTLIEDLLGREPETPIVGVDAAFRSPVSADVEYTAVPGRRDQAGLRTGLSDGPRRCVDVTVRFGPALSRDGAVLAGDRLLGAAEGMGADRLRAGQAVEGRYGPEASALPVLRGRWPRCIAGLGAVHVSTLLWCSYFTGMVLPGASALLCRLRVRFHATTGAAAPLEYWASARTVDVRRGLVTVAAGLGHAGARVADVELTSLVIPPPPAASPERIAAHLPPGTSLQGRVAAVIGGSRGLGAAVVLALASQGATVYSVHRDDDRPLAVNERIVDHRGDAGSPETIRDLRSRLEREHGRLDLLVCNAAPRVRPLDVSPGTLERIDRYLVECTRLVTAPMAGLLDLVERAHGRCLIVSSQAVTSLPLEWPHYVAAKAAVEGFVRWAAEHHPRACFFLARPDALLTAQMNTPVGREIASPTEPVAAKLVSRLIDPTPPSERVELLTQTEDAGT